MADTMNENDIQRFLFFRLEDEGFAFPLRAVKEVVAFPSLTHVPWGSAHLLGIMSLRNEVIPVFDLRIKLGIVPTLTFETCVVICYGHDGHSIGIVVDMILGVTATENGAISEAPSSGSKTVNVVSQVIKQNEALTLVLDPQKLLSTEDTAALRQQLKSKTAA